MFLFFLLFAVQTKSSEIQKNLQKSVQEPGFFVQEVVGTMPTTHMTDNVTPRPSSVFPKTSGKIGVIIVLQLSITF